MFGNKKAEDVFNRNITYFIREKLHFIINAEQYIEEEDFRSELMYQAYHAYFHALKELQYSESNSIKYGRKAIENAAYNIIREHKTQKKDTYIVTIINEEKHFLQRKISIHKLETNSLRIFGDTKDLDLLEETDLQNGIREHLNDKEIEIFNEFILNDFIGLRKIATENNYSNFKIKRALKRAIRKTLKRRKFVSVESVG